MVLLQGVICLVLGPVYSKKNIIGFISFIFYDFFRFMKIAKKGDFGLLKKMIQLDFKILYICTYFDSNSCTLLFS